MPIQITLDVMLAKRKMTLNELSERVGVTPANLSILKTGKARAVRFTTLARLCAVLRCQPGDLLTYEDGDEGEDEGNEGNDESAGGGFSVKSPYPVAQ